VKWIKLDTDIIDDVRIEELVLAHGPDGIAIYITLITKIGKHLDLEKLASLSRSDTDYYDSIRKICTLPGDYTKTFIARKTGVSKNEIDAILITMAELGLIDMNMLKDGFVSIPKIIKRTDDYSRKAVKELKLKTGMTMGEIGNMMTEKYPDSIRTLSGQYPDKIKTKEVFSDFDASSSNQKTTNKKKRDSDADSSQNEKEEYPDSIRTVSGHTPDNIRTVSGHTPDSIRTLFEQGKKRDSVNDNESTDHFIDDNGNKDDFSNNFSANSGKGKKPSKKKSKKVSKKKSDGLGKASKKSCDVKVSDGKGKRKYTKNLLARGDGDKKSLGNNDDKSVCSVLNNGENVKKRRGRPARKSFENAKVSGQYPDSVRTVSGHCSNILESDEGVIKGSSLSHSPSSKDPIYNICTDINTDSPPHFLKKEIIFGNRGGTGGDITFNAHNHAIPEQREKMQEKNPLPPPHGRSDLPPRGVIISLDMDGEGEGEQSQEKANSQEKTGEPRPGSGAGEVRMNQSLSDQGSGVCSAKSEPNIDKEIEKGRNRDVARFMKAGIIAKEINGTVHDEIIPDKLATAAKGEENDFGEIGKNKFLEVWDIYPVKSDKKFTQTFNMFLSLLEDERNKGRDVIEFADRIISGAKGFADAVTEGEVERKFMFDLQRFLSDRVFERYCDEEEDRYNPYQNIESDSQKSSTKMTSSNWGLTR